MDIRFGVSTKTKVSKHIGIPKEDLIVMDLDYKGNYTELRHFVAVDHANKKVVVAIRGTFSASECVVDIDAYSREYTLAEVCNYTPLFALSHPILSHLV